MHKVLWIDDNIEQEYDTTMKMYSKRYKFQFIPFTTRNKGMAYFKKYHSEISAIILDGLFMVDSVETEQEKQKALNLCLDDIREVEIRENVSFPRVIYSGQTEILDDADFEENRGIKVFEKAPDEDSINMGDEAVDADDDAAEEAAAALSSVDTDFGRTTDPVRMYMREMGTVELLTREGEIQIAIRIEEGLYEVLTSLAEFPASTEFVLDKFERIELEEVRLTDVVNSFVDPDADRHAIPTPATPVTPEAVEEKEEADEDSDEATAADADGEGSDEDDDEEEEEEDELWCLHVTLRAGNALCARRCNAKQCTVL